MCIRDRRYDEIHANEGKEVVQSAPDADGRKGRVFDLVIPIVSLIVLCIAAMLYTGGILEGANIIDAFANCDSSLSLAFGSCFTILVIFLLYIPRKVITFREFAQSLVDGFKAMVPAILILTFAWTLSGICGESYLNAGGFVAKFVQDTALATAILPAAFFLIALGLAFATGTSWGTFGILIPIAIAIFGGVESQLLILTVASILAGAVCGDHISPISDTTILASTGAECNHIEHVSTQLPYALLVAGCCFVGYLIAGFSNNGWIALGVSAVLLIILLLALYKHSKNCLLYTSRCV